MYPRNIQNFAREALGDTPVLLLVALPLAMFWS